MRIRAIIGAGAAGVLAAAGAVLIPLAASARTAAPAAKVHTYSFVSVEHKEDDYSQTKFAIADDDVNAKGKVIGFDMLYGTANTKTQKLSGLFTVMLPGGMIYATADGSFTGFTFKGTVTGGSGAFKHAKGSLVAKNLNAAGTKTAVTIKYTL